MMSNLRIGWRRVMEMFGLVRSRQAVKYSKVEKLLMVRIVVAKMDLIYAQKHRLERDNMIKVVNEAEVQGPETDLDESEFGEVRKIAMSVCDEVAQVLGVTRADLKAWFCEFANTNDIGEEEKSETVMNLDYKGKLDIGAAAEAAEYLMSRSQKGHRTTLGQIQAHLNSELRLHPLFDLEIVPKQLYSVKAISRGMRKFGLCSYGMLTNVGKKKNDYTEEQCRKRQWRLRCWWAEMATWRKRELAGEAMIFQMDESFIHRFHHANYGFRPNDAHGQPISELEGDIRPGGRLCIVGGITSFGEAGGHMVAKKPGSDEFYMAQEFRKLGIPSFEPGGHWTELDRDGGDRHAKPKKVKV